MGDKANRAYVILLVELHVRTIPWVVATNKALSPLEEFSFVLSSGEQRGLHR